MIEYSYGNICEVYDKVSNDILYLQDWNDAKLVVSIDGVGTICADHTQVLDMIDAMQKYMRGVIEKMRGLPILVPVGYFGLPDEFHGTIGEIASNGKVEVVILDENNEIDGINIETMRTVIEWRNAWIEANGDTE